MDKFLNTTVILKIGEERLEDTISKFFYDEEGNVTGEKPREVYINEKEQAQGKRVLFVEAVCGDKTARYQSPIVEDDTVRIGNALANVLVTLSGSIARQFRTEKAEPPKITTLPRRIFLPN